MKIRLRIANSICYISAFDDKNVCHISKEITKEEFDHAFDFYYGKPEFEMQLVDDSGQSKELYDILIL